MMGRTGKREIIALLIGQFTGIILIDSGLPLGLGHRLAAIDVLLMRALPELYL